MINIEYILIVNFRKYTRDNKFPLLTTNQIVNDLVFFTWKNQIIK